jgi:hypothetical protein
LKDFKHWLSVATSPPPRVIASPLATERALGEPTGFPDLMRVPAAKEEPRDSPTLESDGLEWPIRLAVLRQQVAINPLRRTQQHDFFKRDLEHLRNDPVLAGTPDAPAPIPEPGLFTVALALAAGLLNEHDAELTGADFTPAWSESLPTLLAELSASLPRLEGWDPVHGWHAGRGGDRPELSAHLLALVLLSRLGPEQWTTPAAIEDWLHKHHPFWRGGKARPAGIAAFLLGVAYLLRLTQARRGKAGSWLVRLSEIGRWAMGLRANPPNLPAFAQTLLVQPNLEILAYRQGLTPSLIAALGRFSTWKTIGPACTLQLEPQSVYRGLEAGDSFTTIVQTLERHGMKALPPAVLDSLRTWSNKRERITVWPAAALFEFGSEAELNAAIERGLPAQRLTDRLAVVASEDAIDFRHFRLTGTRDYTQPPEPCVQVQDDGVTLTVDLVRSDLLLEIELERFAEPMSRVTLQGQRQYQMTPRSLSAARQKGVSSDFLGRWFLQRTGGPLSPAARLLLTAADLPPPALRRQVVLHVANPEIADGLQQWPATRPLIQARLGATALAVAEEDVERLRERLSEIGIHFDLLGLPRRGDCGGERERDSRSAPQTPRRG